MSLLRTLKSGTPRQLRAELRILPWTLLWAGSFLATSLAIARNWLAPGWPVVAAVAVTVLAGAGVVRAYRRYLAAADELRRKIELDALAVAFGVGVVGGITASVLVDAGMVGSNDFLTALFVGMTFTYVGGVLVGHRRYA